MDFMVLFVKVGVVVEVFVKGVMCFFYRFIVWEFWERWRVLLYDFELFVEVFVCMVEVEVVFFDFFFKVGGF